MAHDVGVVGGSGYTGAELLRLVAGHPELNAIWTSAESNAGAAVGDVHPSLAAAYPELRYHKLADGVPPLDLVFTALPHGESQRLVGELVPGARVVDLGADFRLPADVYRGWYGHEHAAPALLATFACGLPELFRAEIRARPNVALPGCYPTATVLALAPLLAQGLVEPTGIVVDAMSGVSGAGRGVQLESQFSEVDASVRAYGLLTHRHTPEIELALGRVAGHPVQVLFTPHLVPMARGLLATCHARPAVSGLRTDRLLDAYRAFYAAEPFVVVRDDPPPTKAATAANTCHVTVRFDERTGLVLALGAIDNLGKGASGQAIQDANLLLGLPETTGLAVAGAWP